MPGFNPVRSRRRKDTTQSDATMKRDRWLVASVVLIGVLCVWSLMTTDLNIGAFFSGRAGKNLVDLVSSMFPIRMDYLPSVWSSVLDTFRMATLGTMLAAILAAPLSFLVARNLHRDSWFFKVYVLPLRGGLNILRGVDTLIWALLLVSITGFGPTAGIVAIAIHNLGSFTKLFYEAIEGIDEAPMEAIEAIGARKLQTIAYAVVPEVIPSFTSTVLYLWEYNFRASQVLGIVGAGGIGLLLNNAIGLYDWPRVAVIVMIIISLVTVFDQVSSLLRNRLRQVNTHK